MDLNQLKTNNPTLGQASHGPDTTTPEQEALLFSQWITDLYPDLDFGLALPSEDLVRSPWLGFDSANDPPLPLVSAPPSETEHPPLPVREAAVEPEGSVVVGAPAQNDASSGVKTVHGSAARQPGERATVGTPLRKSHKGKELALAPHRCTEPKAIKKSATGPARRTNVLVQDRAPKLKDKRDENGGIQGSFRVFGAQERIRSRLTPGARSAYLLTRKVGACERCRRQKLRCDMPVDPLLPCQRCLAVSIDVLKQPCIRVSILDLKLHRKGSTLNNELEIWTYNQGRRRALGAGAFLPNTGYEEREVSVTQDQGVSFRVKVARFSPEAGDTTGWKWRDSGSNEKVMEMPPYYISDTADAALNIRQAALEGRSAYAHCLLAGANSILRKTFEAAYLYLETAKSTLVSNVLTFWVATRFIERPWRVCEGAIPGFEPPDEADCPYNGITPVTPIMDTQIDDIVLRSVLVPLGLNILKELDAKIRDGRRENWFEVFLATFILMNNFEFVFADVIDYTTRHGLKASSTGASSLSKGYFHACKTLLSYFHFSCKGADPLSLCWTGRAPGADLLPFDQQGYLMDIKQDVDRQAQQYGNWKLGSMYQTPLYWCYQVISTNWKPDVPHSTPIDDFTEEDFLTS